MFHIVQENKNLSEINLSKIHFRTSTLEVSEKDFFWLLLHINHFAQNKFYFLASNETTCLGYRKEKRKKYQKDAKDPKKNIRDSTVWSGMEMCHFKCIFVKQLARCESVGRIIYAQIDVINVCVL